MNDLDTILYFSSNQIFFGKGEMRDSCPMKDLNALDIEGSQALYEMHTEFDSPLLHTEEERQSKILEADYSKVDIDAMVNGLDIPKDLKRKLKSMLLTHDTLFSGGLGESKVEPVDIKLKPGFKPYQHKGYYSVPKMFENQERMTTEL